MRITQKISKTNVLDLLQEDKRFTSRQISVDIQGSQVILRGTVDSYQAMIAAMEDAWSIPGVLSVDNRINIIENNAI
jgi:osmotically-inducible protein OsmY